MKTLKQENYSQYKAEKLTYVIATIAKKLLQSGKQDYCLKGQTECAATTFIDRVIPV